MLRRHSFAGFTLALMACGSRAGQSSSETGPQAEPVCLEPVAEGCALHQVPLLRLLAEPGQWRGRRVAVEGYLHLEAGGGTLYPTSEDYQRRRLGRALLTASSQPEVLGPACKCNDQEVVLVGMYDPSDKGRGGAWGGSVKDVEQVEPKKD